MYNYIFNLHSMTFQSCFHGMAEQLTDLLPHVQTLSKSSWLQKTLSQQLKVKLHAKN